MSENTEKKTNLVPAVCTQCGGQLEVDPDQQAAVCPYCNTPFIVEKAINHYNVTHVHQHNTVHIQQGKKGVFQSMADLADRQLEREQNARIRAAELQLEQQKLEMMKEEKKKASRKSFWMKVLWFFGWIYIFPIPATILIHRSEKLDQNKKRIFTGIAWVAYALILLLGGIGGGSSKSTETASATAKPTAVPAFQQSTPVPQTKAAWQEKNAQSNDFDTMEHQTLSVGDYVMDIPAWPSEDTHTYFYPENAGNEFAMFTVTKGDAAGVSDDALVQNRKEYISGVMGNDSFKDSELLSDESFRMNDIVMNSALIHTTIVGNNSSVTGLFRTIWFVNPSDGSLIALQMMESDDCPVGYRDDFEKIAGSVRPAQTQTVSEPAGNGMSFEEFKQKMDSYEQFFNTYVEFMKSYDSSDTSAMMQYLNLMAQYTEAIEALDSIDESTLTPEQDAYYLQVMLRIDQKLLEAANY
ncbi:MAG: hypothetical protein E7190_12330 [Erysipelotrichaceae bacterium]|nr:hypothetical protein [Erysipelotrichaceae bacterium]